MLFGLWIAGQAITTGHQEGNFCALGNGMQKGVYSFQRDVALQMLRL